jgi:hypothetical protein
MLAGVAVNLALLGVALGLHPSIFGAERIPVVIGDVALLVAYAVTVTAWSRQRGPRFEAATLLGVAGGVIQTADIVREYLVDGTPLLNLVAGLSALLVVLALFAVAGLGAGSARAAALNGAWSAMAAMLVIWIGAWILNYVFHARLEQILVTDPEYLLGNTLKDPAAYAVWNTFSAAFSHALLLPCLGAAAAAGAWALRSTFTGGRPRAYDERSRC